MIYCLTLTTCHLSNFTTLLPALLNSLTLQLWYCFVHSMCWICMCLTHLASCLAIWRPCFMLPRVPPGLVVHFYHCHIARLCRTVPVYRRHQWHALLANCRTSYSGSSTCRTYLWYWSLDVSKLAGINITFLAVRRHVNTVVLPIGRTTVYTVVQILWIFFRLRKNMKSVTKAENLFSSDLEHVKRELQFYSVSSCARRLLRHCRRRSYEWCDQWKNDEFQFPRKFEELLDMYRAHLLDLARGH